MGWRRDQFHREQVEQREWQLENEGYSDAEARRLARKQIVHDHDPQDLDPDEKG
jgi:hypothetical protein